MIIALIIGLYIIVVILMLMFFRGATKYVNDEIKIHAYDTDCQARDSILNRKKE